MIEEQDVYKITIPYIGRADINRQETDKKPTTTDNERKVLELLSEDIYPLVDLMAVCGYKDRESFRKSVLNPMLERGWVDMTHPENLRHRDQKYFLTDVGNSILLGHSISVSV